MMDAKDFVMLMLIPILLISIIAYTDANKITGAVAAEKKDSNIIGTYSINPSFKASVDYDLDDYTRIRQSLDSIAGCARNKDIYLCLNDINDNDGFFRWSLDCDRGNEKVLYEFAKFFQECIDSADKNCLCAKDFTLAKQQIEDYGLNKNFKLEMEEIPNEIIRIHSDGTIQDINAKGISIWSPVIYNFGYDTYGIPNINMVFQDLTGSYKVLIGPGPLTKLILYKGQDSMVFAKQENDNLKNPKDSLISDSNNKPVEVSKLPGCSINPNNMYRFCAEKKDFKIMAYDKNDGLVKERSLVVRFAAYIPKAS